VRAGHELSYYPAFYPSDITLTAMSPAEAGAALRDNKLHAYLGAAPTFTGAAPAQLRAVESLAGYVVLTFAPDSVRFKAPRQRCEAAAQVAATLAGRTPPFVVHPFPITPFDADYLIHADRAQQALHATSKLSPDRSLRLRAAGALGETLVRAGWPAAETAWDAEMAEVSLDGLLDPETERINGTVGPPWVRQGWYHAWRLLGSAAGIEAQRGAVERLTRGEFKDPVERYNAERQLVEELTRPCARVVLGYTVRREVYNDEYSFGAENVSWDGLDGLNTPVFVRTVKLKDFPWNGPLFLGIPSRPAAAWNPIAGFGDPAGRMTWSILADDAFMMSPGNASWIPNRIDATSSVLGYRPGGYEVPSNAVLPEAGTGILKRVGPGKRSSAKILYRVLASPYQDGSEMEMADALYPYIFAYRWGGKDGDRSDPAVAAATALLRERVVGILPLNTERRVDRISDLEIERTAIIIEVYLNAGSTDPLQVAALAPPWSAVPWPELALMEEAVRRGVAAFSRQEAARRGVPWLELVRDPAQLDKLRTLAKELEKEKFQPTGLTAEVDPPVTAESAARRWAALRAFDKQNGHFLVTNGPYQLKQWSADSVKFLVVRNFKYAIGIGSFDGFADPSVARVTRMVRQGNDILIEAEVEKFVRLGREGRVVKEPFKKGAAKGFRPITPRALAVLVASDGRVVAALRPHWQEDGRFAASLPKSLPRGRYRVLSAVYADDNAVKAEVGILQVDVGKR